MNMQDKNETAALVRRLGGAAAVARMLDISRQAVHRWIDNDQISENYVPDMLDLCVIDELPIRQSQILARWEMVQRNFAAEK